jgi:tRNA1Val (adenine37-N6)-methyltransferase
MARSDFFRFKKFTVFQDKCSMKVCTDACVLGAWADVENASQILDIGTGTGLLSLMVAQRNPSAHIDALELDEAAFEQATLNVGDSIFANQISVLQGAVQEFETDSPYDSIVVNPPFFQSDLRSPDQGINRAHHAQDLTFDELIIAVGRLLSPAGCWTVLLPLDESKELYNKAQKAGWKPIRTLTLMHKFGKIPFRIITTYSKVSDDKAEDDLLLAIYEADGKAYSPEFHALLKDFYLHF